MKKHLILSAVALSAFLGLFCSCGEDVSSSADAKGRIAPLVGVESELIEAEISSRSLSAPNIKVSDLYLRITSADGSFSREWASVNDFDTDLQFPIGEYTVEAGYADPKAEGLKCKAAYYATADIKVEENKTVPVQLTAARTHAYVTVNFSDAVKAYFRRVGVNVKSASGKTILFAHSSTYSETATACIVPGKATVQLDLEKKNGVSGDNIYALDFTAEARHHYTLYLDVNGGEIGSETLTVSFDENTQQKPVEVDLSDEMLTTPPPTLAIEGVEDGGMLEFVEGCYDGDAVKVIVTARGDIASVNLDSHSTYLFESKFWPLSIDLVNAPDEDRDHMIDAGLDCMGIWNDPNREPSQMGYIDFTNVLNNIKYVDDDVTHDNECTFELSAIDGNKKVSEASVKFSAKINKLQFELSNPSEIKLLDTEISADLTFNGNDVNDVTFEILKDDLGTGAYYGDASVKSLVKIDGQENSYRVTFDNLPTYLNEVTIRAKYKDFNPASLKVDRTGIYVTTTDNDVFAKRAYITLSPVNLDEAIIANPTFILKSEGGKTLKATKEYAHTYLVDGLTPDKINQVTLKLDDPDIEVSTAEFTTEKDEQLVNSNLDDWSKNPHSSYNVEYFVGGKWSTFNPITISQWEESANMAYTATSGTIETSDAVSGKAALIRTVGWGSGNTASANAFNQWSFGTCKHLTIGELFLGDWTGVTPVEGAIPNYGIDFPSRPFGISFKYKYYQNNRQGNDNGDFGTAQIKVMDNEGNLIASSEEIHLGLQNSYKECTVSLKYNPASNKAAKLIVIFKSSGNPNALQKNENYVKPPKPLNLNDGEYVGSQLYIDDIQLIY